VSWICQIYLNSCSIGRPKGLRFYTFCGLPQQKYSAQCRWMPQLPYTSNSDFDRKACCEMAGKMPNNSDGKSIWWCKMHELYTWMPHLMTGQLSHLSFVRLCHLCQLGNRRAYNLLTEVPCPDFFSKTYRLPNLTMRRLALKVQILFLKCLNVAGLDQNSSHDGRKCSVLSMLKG